ncbi:Transmembrane protein 205 [Carex littledalei]|uniref:Transmembrane protein 205 n=1 Tax=Carex littledalei TaxID=544730 RepID=A0A833VEK7_9POAL|nr:Transmembrane protein 205 [Carex littledalei]
MMNLLALGLVLSTLTAAGVLSPPVNSPHHSHKQPASSNQVLREGHRVIVLEYERQVPADTGTGTSNGNGEGVDTGKVVSESTKDKICDAFGVCRDKLSGLFHHGKDKLLEGEETVKKGAKDKVLDVKDAAENKLSQVKDVTGDKLSETKESAENKLFQAKEATKDKLSQTQEGVEDKVSEVKGKIGDKLSNAENKLFQAKDKLSEVGEEVEDKASLLKEEIKEAKEKAGDIAEEAAQNLNNIARRARDVAYDMASYVASPRTSRAVWAVVQLLGFATAYGTCVWVTFISSHVLASALPHQQFGMVQSKVYPEYFRAIAYGVSIAFLAQLIGRGRGSMVEKLQAYNLLGALGMVLVNMFFLEPNATKIMFEIMKAEKEEGRGRDISDMVEPVTTATAATVTGVAASKTTTTTTTAASPAVSFGTAKSTSQTEKHNEEKGAENNLRRLRISLKRWNSYSSLVNVLTLMALTWHLVHLAKLMSCCQ